MHYGIVCVPQQVVMSGESYGSWDGVVGSNTQMGGQGDNDYHTATQKAVLAEDLSGIEEVVSKSGADLATLVCYIHPGLDGKQPGTGRRPACHGVPAGVQPVC